MRRLGTHMQITCVCRDTMVLKQAANLRRWAIPHRAWRSRRRVCVRVDCGVLLRAVVL